MKIGSMIGALSAVLRDRSQPAVVQDEAAANPRYNITPTVSTTPIEETTYTALTGQTVDRIRLAIAPGTAVTAANRLANGRTDIERVYDGSAYAKNIGDRALDDPLTSIYSVGVSALSNPQGDVIGRAAYSFSNIAFSSSTGLLGTCSGSVLPGTGTAVIVTGGTLPTGLVSGTVYYLIRISDTTCKFATTNAAAIAGTAIAYTDAGSGTRVLSEDLVATTLAAQIGHTFDSADAVYRVFVEGAARSSGNIMDLVLKGASYA